MENDKSSFFVSATKYKRPKTSSFCNIASGSGSFSQWGCLRRFGDTNTTSGYTLDSLICKERSIESIDGPKNGTFDSKEVMIPVMSNNNLSLSLKEVNAISNGNDSKKSVARNYPTRRKVSAVREFPLLCGRNAPCVSEEASVEVLAFPGIESLVEEKSKSGINDKISKKMVKIGVKQTVGDAEDGDLLKNEWEGDGFKVIRDNVQPKGFLEVLASTKNKSFGPEKSRLRMGDKPFTEMVNNDLMEIVKVALDGDSCRSELDGNGSKGTRYNLVRCNGSIQEMGDEDVNVMEVRENHSVPPFENKLNLCDKELETVIREGNGCFRDLEENLGEEIVLHSKGKNSNENLSVNSGCHKSQMQAIDPETSNIALDNVVVQGLAAASNCPWRQGKSVCKSRLAIGVTRRKVEKFDYISCAKRHKTKIASGTKVFGNYTKGKSVKKIPPEATTSCNDHGDGAIVTRNKVLETLRLFRKVLQEEEAKPKEGRHGSHSRIDLQAAKMLKDNGKYVNTEEQILGSVVGVEIGDEFQRRMELSIIGLHRQTQRGIDFMRHGGKILAASIVASDDYTDDLENSEVLIYTGQGGNVTNKNKEAEDQKLEWGNLALKNSMLEKNPVRVIRGFKLSKLKRAYIYDGLYLVKKFWQAVGPNGELVFKFQLERIPGQSKLDWKEVKKRRKFKGRKGVCLDDISQGKEVISVRAVNTTDNEKAPSFKYITSLIYPDWCSHLITPPGGCDCTTRCPDSENCSCAVKNGGEIPFNYNGALIEAKPLIYECGPSCKCSPSCHNRVTQHGIRFQLEIFKTKSRGWGLRSVNSIPSGSFVCEYIGELLEDEEAEQRAGNDEYLFDIGKNYDDNSHCDEVLTFSKSTSSEAVEDDGFTIDAAEFGNVGRFINHSCSPNLYAQNVLYDHDDKTIPHIMFFATEDIPSLEELTYDYNYVIDQVHDSNGNIKKKSCFCGSSECTGRLY